jgi:hypothetical protein
MTMLNSLFVFITIFISANCRLDDTDVEGICALYANDDTRSFYFSGVTSDGELHPQLLDLPNWDAVLLGLDAGEDENTLFIVPQGVGSDPNMTIATIKTQTNGTATITYAQLGSVPGFENVAPYTYMPVLHLDSKRKQMIAVLQGLENQPPRNNQPIRDPGDLFLVVADVFPSNGTVSHVWLDLTEQDARWGSGVISGVSAFDGSSFWLNPIGGNVPSGQALYGFPINGSAPTVVPYGAQSNVDHMFFSSAQSSLLVVLDTFTPNHSILAKFSPPSSDFTTIFKWNNTMSDQDYGLYDVSPDGSKLLSVVVDEKGDNPRLVIVDLVHLQEIKRIALKDFASFESLVDINWCNVG